MGTQGFQKEIGQSKIKNQNENENVSKSNNNDDNNKNSNKWSRWSIDEIEEEGQFFFLFFFLIFVFQVGMKGRESGVVESLRQKKMGAEKGSERESVPLLRGNQRRGLVAWPLELRVLRL